jgi:cytochrome c
MVRFSTLLLASAFLALAGCGSAPEEPVEQIIVREPGAPEKVASAAGSGAKSEDAFAVCSACHAVEAGAAAGPGPNLHGVVGRKAGSMAGFGFSDAMKSSGITWTAEELDAFLTDPTAKVPGSSMVAPKLGDAAQRKAIIAYLAATAK